MFSQIVLGLLFLQSLLLLGSGLACPASSGQVLQGQGLQGQISGSSFFGVVTMRLHEQGSQLPCLRRCSTCELWLSVMLKSTWPAELAMALADTGGHWQARAGAWRACLAGEQSKLAAN